MRHGEPFEALWSTCCIHFLDGRYSRIVVIAHGVGTYISYDALTVLWADPRRQGNPWRITDFVTVGSPMALADFLIARPGLFSGFKESDGAEARTVRGAGAPRRTGPRFPLPLHPLHPSRAGRTSGFP
jgi:hypothetical protein